MTQNIIHITKANIHNLEELQTLSRQTFLESFAAVNTKENMEWYLEKAFNKEQLKTELENPETEFYFAVMGDTKIGYLKINFGQAQTELKQGNGLEIERIYVAQPHQGQNIGQVFFNKALEIAQARKADYLWLGVWEKNPGAIRFYERNGLKAFDSHSFQLGDDLQTDIMMKLELKK